MSHTSVKWLKHMLVETIYFLAAFFELTIEGYFLQVPLLCWFPILFSKQYKKIIHIWLNTGTCNKKQGYI